MQAKVKDRGQLRFRWCITARLPLGVRILSHPGAVIYQRIRTDRQRVRRRVSQRSEVSWMKYIIVYIDIAILVLFILQENIRLNVITHKYNKCMN